MEGLEERDRRMAERIERRLRGYGPLRASGSRIQVDCHNHIAVLRGHVRSRALMGTAAGLVRGMDGVREVRNELVCDTLLEVEIAQRLAADPRTKAFAHRVRGRVLLGSVDLRGRVPEEVAGRAVEEIAAGTPGVRAVRNHLEAPAAQPA